MLILTVTVRSIVFAIIYAWFQDKQMASERLKVGESKDSLFISTKVLLHHLEKINEY